jgi:hypothetical protein
MFRNLTVVVLECCRGMGAPRLREAVILSYLSQMVRPPKYVLADTVPYMWVVFSFIYRILSHCIRKSRVMLFHVILSIKHYSLLSHVPVFAYTFSFFLTGWMNVLNRWKLIELCRIILVSLLQKTQSPNYFITSTGWCARLELALLAWYIL